MQNELKARQIDSSGSSTIYTFSSKVVCGDCGSYFGSKLWHSNSKYRRRIWQCNAKYKKSKKCKTPHLQEDQIKDIFIKAFNKLMLDKSGVVSECGAILYELYDTSEIDLKISKLLNEKDSVENDAKKLVMKNANTLLDQGVYNDEYNKFVAKFEKIKQKILELEKQKASQITNRCQTERFLKKIAQTDKFLDEFDEELWFSLVKNIEIGQDGTAIVVFKNGAEIEIEKDGESE
ncbi:MAG: zinc ribbon domain-containing protein [Firmicutes bacterium]|nr:zinc ribbon domain-containing protein [Bacillota bacterium]